MKLFRPLLLALLLLPAVAFAGPYEDGKAAWSRLDYDTAFALFQPLADHGNAQAQYMIGVLYFSGEGVDRDYAQARGWFLKAAGQGDQLAQGKLGLMYDGFGGKQDYQEAYFWKLLSGDSSSEPVRQYQAELSARHLTAEQIAAVKKRVRAWKPVSAPVETAAAPVVALAPATGSTPVTTAHP